MDDFTVKSKHFYLAKNVGFSKLLLSTFILVASMLACIVLVVLVQLFLFLSGSDSSSGSLIPT